MLSVCCSHKIYNLRPRAVARAITFANVLLNNKRDVVKFVQNTLQQQSLKGVGCAVGEVGEGRGGFTEIYDIYDKQEHPHPTPPVSFLEKKEGSDSHRCL